MSCRVNALDNVQRQRQQALLEKVRRTAVGRHELPDGLALTFPTDATMFVELAEWVSLDGSAARSWISLSNGSETIACPSG